MASEAVAHPGRNGTGDERLGLGEPILDASDREHWDHRRERHDRGGFGVVTIKRH
jgi:hypothetical protein